MIEDPLLLGGKPGVVIFYRILPTQELIAFRPSLAVGKTTCSVFFGTTRRLHHDLEACERGRDSSSHSYCKFYLPSYARLRVSISNFFIFRNACVTRAILT